MAENEVPRDEVTKRVDEFNVDLKGLLRKYSLVLFAEPEFFRGAIVARVKVKDEADYMLELEASKKGNDAPEVKSDEQGIKEN